MDRKPLPPGLHIVLGDSAAQTFLAAFGNDQRLLVDRDVLSVGPTRHCDDIAAWRRMRNDFWNELVPALTSEHQDSPRDLLSNLELLDRAESITAWCATSVSEQLFLSHVVGRLAERNIEPARLRIVQFETLANRKSRVLGIGELTAEQLAQHPPPTVLPREALAAYQDAWTALTAENPAAMAAFADTHPDAGPLLRHAFQAMLRRFPDIRTGLTHWDRRLLEDVRSHGPRGTRVIGHTLVQNLEDADLVGDWYLFGRMLRMGSRSLPQPLLEIGGDPGNMRATDVRLTPFGLDVLDGRASNYPTNPISDWVAGVRLDSARGKLWFDDGGRLVPG